VFLLQSLNQCRTYWLSYPNYGITVIKRLRRIVFPFGAGRVNRNIVPNDARAIVLTHRRRNQPALIPELGSAGYRISCAVSPSKAMTNPSAVPAPK